eukprot:GHVU01195920.1.p1 GENE.GHVU01195920.1~~GHVU01195920.1.p1  ORF type:complete len:142 (+),score=32.86 GHVU01195920.1:374-799(+)
MHYCRPTGIPPPPPAAAAAPLAAIQCGVDNANGRDACEGVVNVLPWGWLFLELPRSCPRARRGWRQYGGAALIASAMLCGPMADQLCLAVHPVAFAVVAPPALTSSSSSSCPSSSSFSSFSSSSFSFSSSSSFSSASRGGC